MPTNKFSLSALSAFADLKDEDGNPAEVLSTDYVLIERDGMSYRIGGNKVGGSTVLLNWYKLDGESSEHIWW